MDLAKSIAKRSTCSRKNVGTVITSVDHRKVLSVGYNGNASGLHNGCDSPDAQGLCGCIHSENNAIINCDAPRGTEKYVYVTLLPCKMCAKALINLGNIKTVFYWEDYRDKTSLELFKQVGIEVIKMGDANE
jgi:deoxycytidylate deaminase